MVSEKNIILKFQSIRKHNWPSSQVKILNEIKSQIMPRTFLKHFCQAWFHLLEISEKKITNAKDDALTTTDT